MSSVLGARAMKSAWEGAFARHYESLLRFGVLLCGDRYLAEDLTQEAFIRAARHLESVDEQAVWSYLRRVLLNLWKNRLRRLAVELRAGRRRTQESDSDAFSSFEDQHALWQQVLKLPKRQRACLVLRYYESLSEKEIADELNISVGTVKSQTARALHRLRKEVGDAD